MNKRTPPSETSISRGGITVRALLLGVFFAGIFAYVTVMREHTPPYEITTATQVAVFPILLLIGMLLLINPIIKLVFRFLRPFTLVELMIVFVMGSVSSGISTFGLASQLVPMVSSLMNPYWNNDQSRWDVYVEPYVSDKFFVAEENTRQAAVRFKNVHEELREAQSIFRAAKSVSAARDQHQQARELHEEAKALPEDNPDRDIKINAALQEIRFAERAISQAEKSWAPYEEDHQASSVLQTYPERIERLTQERDEKKQALQSIKADAEEAVEVFRKGLPEEMRAIPGFVHTTEENFVAYRARIKRLMNGVKALDHVRTAESVLADRGMNSGTGTLEQRRETALDSLDKAIDILEPISELPALREQLEQARQDSQDCNEQLHNTEQNLRALQQRRRVAPVEYFNELDKQIENTEDRVDDLKEQSDKLSSLISDKLLPPLNVTEKVQETKEQLQQLRDRIAEAQTTEAMQPLTADLVEAMGAFRTFDASFDRFLFGDVNWSIWVTPIAQWSILILLTYLVLMTFNVLIFRQWAYNERLIYPLAELPMLLAGGTDEEYGIVPPLYRCALFWVGVAISSFVLGWNIMASGGVIPGVSEISLTFELTDYVKGTAFEGISPGARLHVFFTLIGLSFLIPARISHSLWLFHVGYMFLLLVLVWLGLGVDERSFPYDWMMVLNFRTALGGGALLVFASVVLWKCRQYIFCFLNPVALEGLPDGERRELRISSWLFVGGSLGLIAMLTWGMGANLFFSILCYLVILIITIGLVRAVAEGGILGFQCHFGPFHLIRSVLGMNHAWTAPSLFAPILIFYSIMFLDIKTFIAPAMANALKIRDDAGMGRTRFHVGIAAGILVAMGIAILTHIILGYSQGADAMHGWFYSHFPQQVFDTIKTMTITEPTDSAGARMWLLTGCIVMGLLIYFRQRVFWLPHPIGMIMLVNPLMAQYWFSILLGWLFKNLVTKYGNKTTYATIRTLFVGLIVGELIMCMFGATLNR